MCTAANLGDRSLANPSEQPHVRLSVKRNSLHGTPRATERCWYIDIEEKMLEYYLFTYLRNIIFFSKSGRKSMTAG